MRLWRFLRWAGGMTAGMCAACWVCGTATAQTTSVAVRDAAPASRSWSPDPGPYQVGEVRELLLHDAARNKDLRVLVRYPRVDAGDPTTLPLVVFSHGMGGSGPTAFPELTTLLARHGYVVVLPTHGDSLSLAGVSREDRRAFRDDPRAYTRKIEPHDRLLDVKLVLDSLSTLEERVDGLRDGQGKGRVDRDRLAMAGHSAGALTTQMALGVKVRGTRLVGQGVRARDALALRSVGDGRLKAGVVISGQGLDNRGLTEQSWSAVDVPLLVISGSNDTSPASDATPQTRTHPFVYSRGEKAGGPPAYLLWIEGATHGSYQGQGLARLLGELDGQGRVARPAADARTPDEQENDVLDVAMVVRTTNACVLTFLDAHVKGDPAALARLGAAPLEKDPDAATFVRDVSDGRAWLQRK